MGLGATNKRKGSNAERYYANYFKGLGFTFCKTSRQVSKQYDNAKIDLMYVPFNIQIKAGVQKNMNPGKELYMMSNCIKTMFPPEEDVHKKPCLLIHYKQGIPRVTRTPEMEMLYMSSTQFEVFKDKNPFLQYQTLKEFKFDLYSEYKTIVGMTVEYFTREIILKKHY